MGEDGDTWEGNEDRSSAEGSSAPLLRVLWERKLVVLLAVVACAAAAAAVSLTAERQYTASAEIVFRDPGFAKTLFGSDLFEGSATQPERRTSTNVSVLESASVTSRVARRLGLRQGSDLKDLVKVEAGENSDLATITAQTGDPVRSAIIANTYASEYLAYQRDADRQKIRDAQRLVLQSLATATPAERPGLSSSLRQLRILEALQTGNAEQVARAEPADQPSSPRPVLYTLLAAGVGLVLGSALALLADRVDVRLKTSQDFERAFGHSVIANIPRGAVADKRTGELSGRQAEPYRILRESLRFLEVASEHRCVLVTSPQEGEGKTTVAVNLARALAAGGQRVVIVEGDLRRPNVVSQMTDERPATGLSSALLTSTPVGELLVDAKDEPGVRILPTGVIPPNPPDLLRSPRLAELIEEVEEMSDTVIIDSPPLLPVADTQVLLDLERISGVLLVGRSGSTRRDAAREARRVLGRSGRRVLGVVVTFTRERQLGYYYYGDAAAADGKPQEVGAGMLRRGAR